MWTTREAITRLGAKRRSQRLEKEEIWGHFPWPPFLASASRFNLEEENTENTESDEAEEKAEYRPARCFLLELKEEPGLWNGGYVYVQGLSLVT